MDEFEIRSKEHHCECLVKSKMDTVHLCVFRDWDLVCYVIISELYYTESGYEIELRCKDSRNEKFKVGLNHFEVIKDVFDAFEEIIG